MSGISGYECGLEHLSHQHFVDEFTAYADPVPSHSFFNETGLLKQTDGAFIFREDIYLYLFESHLSGPFYRVVEQAMADALTPEGFLQVKPYVQDMLRFRPLPGVRLKGRKATYDLIVSFSDDEKVLFAVESIDILPLGFRVLSVMLHENIAALHRVRPHSIDDLAGIVRLGRPDGYFQPVLTF